MKLADHQSVLAEMRLKMTQAESKLTTLQKRTVAIASSESKARSQLQQSNDSPGSRAVAREARGRCGESARAT